MNVTTPFLDIMTMFNKVYANEGFTAQRKPLEWGRKIGLPFFTIQLAYLEC